MHEDEEGGTAVLTKRAAWFACAHAALEGGRGMQMELLLNAYEARIASKSNGTPRQLR